MGERLLHRCTLHFTGANLQFVNQLIFSVGRPNLGRCTCVVGKWCSKVESSVPVVSTRQLTLYPLCYRLLHVFSLQWAAIVQFPSDAIEVGVQHCKSHARDQWAIRSLTLILSSELKTNERRVSIMQSSNTPSHIIFCCNLEDSSSSTLVTNP